MDLKLQKLNPGGEYQGYGLVLENGDFATVSGAEEIAQNVLNRLKLNFQEWYLYNGGINWTRDVFKQPAGSIVAEDTIKREILLTTGVVSIEEFRFLSTDPATRASSIFIRVEISTGDIEELEIPL